MYSGQASLTVYVLWSAANLQFFHDFIGMRFAVDAVGVYQHALVPEAGRRYGIDNGGIRGIAVAFKPEVFVHLEIPGEEFETAFAAFQAVLL